ncbi:MAG: hypothetical protein IKK30_06710 [Clostridia bacterium]|nr:hypothetical protein [Clostridia bacterium]
MKWYKRFLKIIAGGLMVIVLISIFSVAFAIGSLEEGYVTYECSVWWQGLSILTFAVAGILMIVTATAADKIREMKKPPTVRQHR